MAHDLYVGGKLSVTGTVDFPGGSLDSDLVTNLNADKLDSADKDTDVNLSANSDAKIPSQKAVKTYSDTAKADLAGAGRTTETIKDNADDIAALDAAAVKKTSDQTINGVKTFGSIPVLPASDPTADNQAARKKYVADLDAQNVKLSGNQSIAGLKTFTTGIDCDDYVIVHGELCAGGVIKSPGNFYQGNNVTENTLFDLIFPCTDYDGQGFFATGVIVHDSKTIVISHIIRTHSYDLTFYGMDLGASTLAPAIASVTVGDGDYSQIDHVSVCW